MVRRSLLWTKTTRGKNQTGSPPARGTFEVLFRLYGPEKPFFDKTWKLPDIEIVK